VRPPTPEDGDTTPLLPHNDSEPPTEEERSDVRQEPAAAPQPVPGTGRRHVLRRVNLSVRAHRSPVDAETVYFCECDNSRCHEKIFLSDERFDVLAASATCVTSARCPGGEVSEKRAPLGRIALRGQRARRAL
jgi:hypothetical protein